MSELWTEKYCPQKLEEVLGQNTAIREIKKWVSSWEDGKPEKRAILIYGAPGTGKTATVRALAKEMGWSLIEMNASDKRTLSEVERIIGVASTTGTLTGGAKEKKLLVLDEADNLHGTADRGGYRALKNIIGKTNNPIVLIANDRYSIPWEIQNLCFLVNFRRLKTEIILLQLEKIVKKEKIRAEKKALEIIARAADGDMRSAIQDLQTVTIGEKILTEKILRLYKREREKNVFDLIKGILLSSSAQLSRTTLWSVDVPPEDALAWISENIPRAITNRQNLAKVYDAISRADIFLRRAKERQVYKLWGYASDMMSAGVTVNKGEEISWTRFQTPSHIKRYSRTRVVRMLQNSIAKKMAKHCHTSTHIIKRDFIPLFALLKRDKNLMNDLAERLELSENELNYLFSM